MSDSGLVLDRRSFFKMSAAVTLAGGRAWARSESQPSPANPRVEPPQLFLDDAIIARMSGLVRRLHPPRKMGLIQEADGSQWDRGGIISLARDLAGRFHMTYFLHYWDASVRDLHPSIGNDKAHWFRMPVGYATSDDGIRWQKPVLGKIKGPTGFRRAPRSKWKDGQFEEPVGLSLENNLGCPIHMVKDLFLFGGMNDPRRRYLVNVIEKDDDHAFARMTDAGLYFASDIPDPRDPSWRSRAQKIWEGKHQGPRSASVRPAGYDVQTGLWFEMSQSAFGGFQRRGGRDIARWTSRDLLNWSAEELVLPIAEDESQDPRDYVEYMDITTDRVGDFWLGKLLVFHGDRSDPQGEMPTQKGVWRKGYTDQRLVISRDAGRTWSRVCDKQVWLAPHPEENGYDRLLGMSFVPARVGDELWLYYGCWDGDHLSWNKDGTTYYPDRARIWRTARAVLRWDGFVSLDAKDQGELVTRSFRLNGTKLTVNAKAAKGEVRVALQTESGDTVAGYGEQQCSPLKGDGISQVVTWGSRVELPTELRGRMVRLRFLSQEAELYGFHLTH